MYKITEKQIVDFLHQIEGQSIHIDGLMKEFNLESDNRAQLRAVLSKCVKNKIAKPSGARDGWYKVIRKVEPIRWWNGEMKDPLEFLFPRSHSEIGGDETEFGIEDLVEIFPGDFILLAGFSNGGKTAMALNILAENLQLMPAVLMGSEYTAADGKISPKFKRRMGRMKWVSWIEDGEPKFQLYPIGSDYEDYIHQDCQNYLDWISLPSEYYLIDSVSKAIKDKVGNGIVVGVLQKNRTSEFAEGGERAERYADLCMYIDPYGETESMLRLGKVKAPKGRATGRMWAFQIVDYGANFHNIREIVKCSKCWGKGYIRSGQNNIRCPECQGKKYVDK